MSTHARLCAAGSVSIGPSRPLAIIAGPCLFESLEMGLEIGKIVRDACNTNGLQYIFKASFDKANRSSIKSARGPGLAKGMEWFQIVKKELGVPVTTDVHEPAQAMDVAKVVDLLQVPAFLCRQTDLLCACGEAANKFNRAVNVKKGQFLAPHEMSGPVRKLEEAGCNNILLTERGTTFGYGRLVNDFLGLGDMMELKLPHNPASKSPPVCFDATHSTQLPGAGETTGGRPERAPLLAKAAVAAGVHAIFMECHQNPPKAQSDASTMLTLESVPALIKQLAAIRKAIT
ncbi:MAG: 3-deoxy-8-phosphooctulonate synthase [Phycisphaerales bacterium]